MTKKKTKKTRKIGQKAKTGGGKEARTDQVAKIETERRIENATETRIGVEIEGKTERRSGTDGR